MEVLLISVAAFVCVACLVGAIFSMSSTLQSTSAEDRLMSLAGLKMPGSDENRGIMRNDKFNVAGAMGESAAASFSKRLEGLSHLFEQADSPIDFATFLMISAACGAAAGAGAYYTGSPTPLVPVFAIMAATLPLMWLMWRRSGRYKKFGKQMPDAMELIARALRSGHSLQSGLSVVVNEMPPPISQEFGLAYEAQNLGVPIEQSLKQMLKRMPNMDLKFFVTAVSIQRTTGGDLAEILDNIGHIIRERFKILGTVQALTAEGRLSGGVLMALPIAIFVAVYNLNPEYVGVLFTHPLGKQMIAAGIFLQILGAIVIKKIIDIKV